MKLDASREFEAFTGTIASIKMHANLLGDTEVLESLVDTLAGLLNGMFLTLSQDVEKDVLRALLENRYEEILRNRCLERIKP